MKSLALISAAFVLAILLRPHVPSLYVSGVVGHLSEATVLQDVVPSPTPTPDSMQVVGAIVKEFAPEGKTTVKKMLDISFCESGWRWDAVNHNTNGTTDHGSLQINSVHIKRFGTKFTKDLTENVRVAHEMYKEQGTNPWVCAKVLGMR